MRAPDSDRGGRPPLPVSTPVMIWAFVELMRDRRYGGKPMSARQGSARLQQAFAKDMQGGRFLTTETIRRHHKDTERLMRKGSDPDLNALAKGLLEYGRQRRELFGWQAVHVWQYLMGPENFPGYDKTETGEKFVLTRPK
jgi:hypothetical protein